MPLLVQALHQLCFRIAKAKTFHADEPLPARWTDGGMLDIWAALDRIALPPQRFQKCIIGQAPSQRCVNVAADKVTDRTTAALFCVPCRIRHAFSIRFNHGVSEFPADFIGNAAQIVKVAFEIAAILSAIHERNRIENNVAMQVVTVGVRTDNGFVFVS